MKDVDMCLIDVSHRESPFGLATVSLVRPFDVVRFLCVAKSESKTVRH